MKRTILLWFVLLMGVLISPISVLSQETNPNVTVHVVQRGENLYRIGLRYGVTINELARFNGIINPSNISVGQRILIPLEPAAEVIPPQTHIVGAGESLNAIASFYGVEEQLLIELNNLDNPNALFIGQVLTITPETEVEISIEPEPTEIPATEIPEIPEAGASEPTALPEPALEDSESNATAFTHTVGYGESLFRIAQKYGIGLTEIQLANSITNASVIYPGQVLIIPNIEIANAENTAFTALPETINSFDITPLMFKQGQTGRIIISTRNAATVTVDFLGKQTPAITDASGINHVVYLPVPRDTPENIYQVTVNVADVTGQQTVLPLNVSVLSGGYYTQYVNIPSPQSELLNTAIEDNETTILRTVTSPNTPESYFSGPISLPVAAPMNARFGVARSYNGGTYDSVHLGTDFAAPPGATVFAAAPGRVVLADELLIRGNVVALDHGQGVYTVYAHMSERYVNIGEFVQGGQALGAVGTTGRSTGAHLHWELWIRGEPVDPMQWVASAFP